MSMHMIVLSNPKLAHAVRRVPIRVCALNRIYEPRAYRKGSLVHNSRDCLRHLLTDSPCSRTKLNEKKYAVSAISVSRPRLRLVASCSSHKSSPFSKNTKILLARYQRYILLLSWTNSVYVLVNRLKIQEVCCRRGTFPTILATVPRENRQYSPNRSNFQETLSNFNSGYKEG
ncbi:hypothetical protein SEUBUCD646_0D00140 [Saccharomyces eubayanus]|uniref:Uncharacterized protein n=1 Tax=Saccharomyces eubayanus TaxID=1080349 RepID=A0ABN8VME9_SACEU|nr:hypothetical protein SEUBUCD650_0D00130 [Saccharomyces eubayanus]CAI1917760.1 hypothetical protein SEUBUCD646_0D00140 [Saccharomyces eubayanus]